MERSAGNGRRAGGSDAPEHPVRSRRAGVLTAVLGLVALVPTAVALTRTGSADSDWRLLALGLVIKVESTAGDAESWWAAPGPAFGVGLLLLSLVRLLRR